MSRPQFKGRELMFIGLPTALIVAGAAFLLRQQAVREQKRSGPYRTEITRVQVLPVSPFEAWQGFDTKIVVYAKGLGQVNAPQGVHLYPEGRLEQKVALVGRINGQLKNLGVTSQDYGQGFEPEHPGVLRAIMVPSSAELKDTLTFLVATSGFDVDSPIQLKGDLWNRRAAESTVQISPLPARWTSKKSGASWWLYVRSEGTALSQPLDRAMGVNVDHIEPPVKNVEADLLSPVYTHTGMVGDNGNAIVHINFKPNSFSNHLPLLRSTAAQVFDSHGRIVQMKDSYGFGAYKTVGWDMNANPASAVVRLPLDTVTSDRGALKMKVWFAIEDGWPIKVETEVRPAWMSRTPHTLQLQKVSVQGGDVVVLARYTGTVPLKYQSQVDYRGQGKPLYFDERDDPIVGFIAGVNYKRLYTYWSQHYTLANGKSYWFPNAVSIQSVGCDASGQCRIVYRTNALGALKPGQSAHFSAHIGVQGDGLLPVEATITRPKKSNALRTQ